MWTEAIGIVNVFDQIVYGTIEIQIGTSDKKIIDTVAKSMAVAPTCAFVAEQLPGGDLVLRKVPVK